MTSIKYSSPVPFHKAMPGSKSIPIWKRVDDDDELDKRRKKKPKSNFAGYRGVDEEGFIPNSKRENNITNDYDMSRGDPWYAMLDRQARAMQQQTGNSYEKCFTAAYTDPKNIAIKDSMNYEHLAKNYDAQFGTKLSMAPLAKDSPVEVHKIIDKLARERSDATGQTYAKCYTDIYCSPENIALRNGTVSKAAADPIGPAHSEMADLVAAYMATHPKATREMAFTAIYTDAGNRALKDRFDDEAAMRAHGVPPFASYSAPGHAGEASNVGRSGAKPRGWQGG
jgi:hypothetical protein